MSNQDDKQQPAPAKKPLIPRETTPGEKEEFSKLAQITAATINRYLDSQCEKIPPELLSEKLQLMLLVSSLTATNSLTVISVTADKGLKEVKEMFMDLVHHLLQDRKITINNGNFGFKVTD